MAIKIGDLKNGQGIRWRDGIWIIQHMEHVKPGKGPAYLQTDMKNPKTGQSISNRFRPEEPVEPVFFLKQKGQYLFSDSNSHVIMDGETFEQIEVPLEHIGDKSVYLVEDVEVEISSVDGEIISADLPNTINLKVVDTPPNLKGATATNQLKDAICDGGARIKVPPFVENDTIIEVDTRTGEYLGRV